MGRPIVVTPQAFEGIDAEPGRDLMVAHGEREFAARTIELLTDPALADRMGHAARMRAEQSYSWARNLAILNELLPMEGTALAFQSDQQARQAGAGNAVSRAS